MSGFIILQIVIFFHRLTLCFYIWYILNGFSIKLLSIFISDLDMMLVYRYECNKRSIIKTWPNVILHTILSGFLCYSV